MCTCAYVYVCVSCLGYPLLGVNILVYIDRYICSEIHAGKLMELEY